MSSAASSPAIRRAWTSNSSPWVSTSVQNGGSTLIERAATGKREVLAFAAVRGRALLRGLGPCSPLAAPAEEGQDAEHDHDQQEAVEPRGVADPAEGEGDDLDDRPAEDD